MKDVTELTSEDKQSSVVYFTSPTCAPCRTLGPMMEELSEEYGDVKFLRVSIDKAPEVTLDENVRGVPTVKLYREGQVDVEFIGLKTRSEYTTALDNTFSGSA